MKKISIIMAIFMAVLLVSFPICAVPNMMVSNGVSASQGEVITIWVSLSEVVDAKSGYVSAVYDQTVLELISASFHFSNNPSISGFIKEEGVFAYVDVVGISGNIVAYQFAIKNSASVGEHDVRISMEIKDGAGNSSFMAATSVVNVAVSLPTESTKETTTQVTTQTTTMTTIIETTTVNTTTVSSYPETTAQTTTSESASAQATTMESTTAIATSSTIAVETSSATSMTIQTETQVMTSLTTDMQSETEVMTSESSSVEESSISSNKLSMDEKNTLIIWLTITCNLIIILVAGLIICRIKKKK